MARKRDGEGIETTKATQDIERSAQDMGADPGPTRIDADVIEEGPGIRAAGVIDASAQPGDPAGLTGGSPLPDGLGVGEDSTVNDLTNPGGSSLFDDFGGTSGSPMDDLGGGGGIPVIDDQRGWALDGGGGGPGSSQGDPPLGGQGGTTGQWTEEEDFLSDLAHDLPEDFPSTDDYDHFVQPTADDPAPGSFVEDENDPTNSGFVWGSDYAHDHRDDSDETEYQTQHGQEEGSATQPHIIDPWEDDDTQQREDDGGGETNTHDTQSMPIPPEADDGTGGGSGELDPTAMGDRGDPAPEVVQPSGGGELIGGRGDIDPAPELEDDGGSGSLDTVAAGLGAVDPAGASMIEGDEGDLMALAAESDVEVELGVDLDDSLSDLDLAEGG
jgi:hypothetical protein